MIKAKNVDVKNYGCETDTGMFIPTEFTEPVSDYDFFYEPPTNESFGGGNWKDYPDPYEKKMVKMAPSSIPNSGEGVFLLKDTPLGRPACWYSMFMYRAPDQTEIYKLGCVKNTSKSEEYRRECEKYSLYLSTYDAKIHLPQELDINPLPNLGPKVNHHFRLNNSAYIETEHPRWGYIQSVTPWNKHEPMNKDGKFVKAGQELFTYYGYSKKEFPYDFPWYWEQKNQIERDERLRKEAESLEKMKKSNKKCHKVKKLNKKIHTEL